MKLHDIAEEIRKCTACPLWKKRLLPVPGDGKQDSEKIILFNAPNEEENRKGEVLQVSLSEKVFATPLVKCFSDGLEVTEEIKKTCTEKWLVEQIKLIEPQEVDLSRLDEGSKEILKSFLKK